MPGTRRPDQLPSELVGLVASELDAASLAALRLVSKDFKTIFTPKFLSHINEIQSIEFTIDGLGRLRGLSLSTDLKPLVRTICLVCPYYHITPAPRDHYRIFPGVLYPRRQTTGLGTNNPLPPLDFLQSSENRVWMDRKISTQSAMHLDTPSTCQLLAEAFCNFGTLTGICLEAVVVLNPERQCSPEQAEYLDWRDMWQGTLKLFRILISAISQSQIRVESLQIFKETNICSIPINELAAIKDGRFEKVASHLQKLSISLSPIPKTPITLRRLDTSRSRNDSAEIVSFDDVKRLLQIMPKLETLYLHFFQVSPTKTSELRAPCHDMLEMIMMDTKMVFPLLKDVSLKCLPITTPAIGHLLARCPQLHSLSLEYVELLGNRWGEALAPIISSSVANLNLSNLYSCFILETPRPVGIITNRGRGDVTIRAAQALHAKKPQSTQLKYRDRDVEKEESLGPNDRRRGVMIEIGSESLIEGGFASPERKLRAMRLRLLCGPPPGL